MNLTKRVYVVTLSSLLNVSKQLLFAAVEVPVVSFAPCLGYTKNGTLNTRYR